MFFFALPTKLKSMALNLINPFFYSIVNQCVSLNFFPQKNKQSILIKNRDAIYINFY